MNRATCLFLLSVLFASHSAIKATVFGKTETSEQQLALGRVLGLGVASLAFGGANDLVLIFQEERTDNGDSLKTSAYLKENFEGVLKASAGAAVRRLRESLPRICASIEENQKQSEENLEEDRNLTPYLDFQRQLRDGLVQVYGGEVWPIVAGAHRDALVRLIAGDDKAAATQLLQQVEERYNRAVNEQRERYGVLGLTSLDLLWRDGRQGLEQDWDFICN